MSAAALLLATPTVQAGESRAARVLARCQKAVEAEVELASVPIDAIRVVLDRVPGDDGSVLVELDVDGDRRSVVASARGTTTLRFSPALVGEHVRLSVGGGHPCVGRVELLSGGQVVQVAR